MKVMSPSFLDYLRYLLAKSIAVLVVATILIVGIVFVIFRAMDRYQENEMFFEESDDCNVAVILLKDGISTMEDGDALSVDQKIYDAENDENIKGILLEVNSPGGSPVASEILMNDIKRSTKPTLALIQEIGTSGAYLVSSGADWILASKLSTIGSIGVTQSYLETAGESELAGSRYVSLSAGKYKDAGDSDRRLTDEEKALIMRDVNITYDEFVRYVAENRNLFIEDVKKLADGSAMLGEQALRNKLIDGIGDEVTAMDWFEEKLGEPISICERW